MTNWTTTLYYTNLSGCYEILKPERWVNSSEAIDGPAERLRQNIGWTCVISFFFTRWFPQLCSEIVERLQKHLQYCDYSLALPLYLWRGKRATVAARAITKVRRHKRAFGNLDMLSIETWQSHADHRSNDEWGWQNHCCGWVLGIWNRKNDGSGAAVKRRTCTGEKIISRYLKKQAMNYRALTWNKQGNYNKALSILRNIMKQTIHFRDEKEDDPGTGKKYQTKKKKSNWSFRSHSSGKKNTLNYILGGSIVACYWSLYWCTTN